MKAVGSILVCMLAVGLIELGPHRLALAQANRTAAQAQPPAEEVDPDPWPKSAQVNGATYTLYQPQLETWDGYNLEGHAAVSVRPAGAKSDTFGAIAFSAVTLVDKETRTVRFQNIKIQKANFPSAPDKADQYLKDIQSLAANGPAAVPLDRLQAALGVVQAQQKGQAVPVINQPPNFIFSQTSAFLVLIDGEPKWTDIPNTQFARAINTRALLLRDQSRKIYLHVFDGFMEADNLSGPWTVATSVPSGADSVAQQLAKEGLVDLMEGPPNEKDPAKKPSLKTRAPAVYAETVPSELIVIEGKPDWVSIIGTKLLYVNNTTADIAKDLDNQQTYVLVTGRWFSGPGFGGPWQYVAGTALPPDFAKIPDDSPKENIKASIPGTAQAQEAVISTQIPQTATVNKSTTSFTPRINGAPDLKPIEGTPLSYVFNSADPIIQVPTGGQAADGGGGNGADSAAQWYAVHDGVWFNAGALTGPWLVAASVPPVIYSIPPSSPVYYVTYVKVYASTPQEVVDGYTPGYLGTVVSSDGTVVYGTGYQYPAYVSDNVYYPAPATYGYGTERTWTPWLGWAFGFGMGWLWGAGEPGWDDFWGWGVAPYWGGYAGLYGAAFGPRGGAAVWGPGGWAGTTGNVYRHFGSTGVVGRASGGFNAWTGNAWSRQVGRSYNSTTGRISAGHRSSVQNVYTGNSISHARGGTYNPTTGTGARGGRTTFTNPATGKSGTVGHGTVVGPQGGKTHFANVNGNFYADHNGNVYRGNTADGFQRMGNNGQWSNVEDRNALQSLQSHDWSRQFASARSAGSSWGGNWSGFNRGFSGDHFGGDRFGGGWGGGRFGGGFGGGRFGGGLGGFRGDRLWWVPWRPPVALFEVRKCGFNLRCSSRPEGAERKC